MEPQQPKARTRLWAGSATEASRWPSAPLSRCPSCNASTVGRPFCIRDGTLTASTPFSIGKRYLVEELLGGGGMSLVFGARHELLGKPVALKILRDTIAADPAQTQRFMREARLASQLHHENIIDVSDFGRDEELGVLFLVMERLRGRTLAAELARYGRLPWRRAVSVLVQLCRALDAAHRENVLHRDVNPSNVFLVQASVEGDRAKLCDFGLSRLATGEDRVTALGTFLGTPAYMAPEQLRGDEDQDARVDLYALGTTAYELLAGRLPHAATNPVALVTSKLQDDPVPLADPDIPLALEKIVMRCLARDPAARPKTAQEVEQALLEIERTTNAWSTAKRPDELVGQEVGTYRITSLLGSGGVGAVYLGEHPVIGTRVAIKVLLPEMLAVPGVAERFVFEARAASQIDSPHMVRYHDFGQLPGGQPYAVMEYLEGETIDARLARSGPFSVEETVSLVAQVTSALLQAHAAGIIHRDIKPENLFLVTGPDARPLVKVLDFGIAKLAAPEKNAKLTQIGYIVGTPYYAPPEQLLGAEIGPAVDTYALGSTAFEMLTGRPPFEGDVVAIIGAKTSQVAPPLSALRRDVPPELTRVVARMLERDPALRPSMSAVQVALHQPRAAARRIYAWLGAGAVVVVITVCAFALKPAAPSAPTVPAATPVIAAPAVQPTQPTAEPPIVTQLAHVEAPAPQPAPPLAPPKTVKPRLRKGTPPAKAKSTFIIADPFQENP